MIAPGVLITNHHVLPDAGVAERSEAQFQFERDIDGRLMAYAAFALDPERLDFSSNALDFSVVAVRPTAHNAETAMAEYGYLPLVATLGKVAEGEWLTIIQRPNGEQEQVCVRENRFVKRMDDVIWYSTDTVGGSSGSPVFNNDWHVVALHHSGVSAEQQGRIQTIDGRDFDPERDTEADIRWLANEGIRVSRIVETLKAASGSHQLLQPVFGATPENARIPDAADPLSAPSARPITRTNIPQQEPASMSESSSSYPEVIRVALRIARDGSVSLDEAASRASERAFVEARPTRAPLLRR